MNDCFFSLEGNLWQGWYEIFPESFFRRDLENEVREALNAIANENNQ